MLSKTDKIVIRLVSQDIPLAARPFGELSSGLGMGERAFIERIKSYKQGGLLRKFSAALNHKKIGFLHNAMVVWNVPVKNINKAGRLMATFTQVSHCYQRKSAPDWKYNLYSMVHGRTRKECLQAVKDISRDISCKDYKVLFSTHEYKKSAPEYF